MPRSSPLRKTSVGLTAILTLVVWTGCRSAATPAPAAPGPSNPSPAPAAAAAAPQAPAANPDPTPPAAPIAPAAPAAPAPPYKNTIRWATASEVDSFGFDVYRSEKEDGPFVRLTSRPIAGAGTSDESHSYTYVDDTIDPTKEYYYYVESISISGDREIFTPVNRARAKLQPAPSPTP